MSESHPCAWDTHVFVSGADFCRICSQCKHCNYPLDRHVRERRVGATILRCPAVFVPLYELKKLLQNVVMPMRVREEIQTIIRKYDEEAQ